VRVEEKQWSVTDAVTKQTIQTFSAKDDAGYTNIHSVANYFILIKKETLDIFKVISPIARLKRYKIKDQPILFATSAIKVNQKILNIAFST